MIVFVRSNDVNPDPRLQKYIDFLEKKEEPFLVLAWNRAEKVIEKPNHEYFHLKAKYGTRYFNIFNKLKWFFFVFRYLIKHKSEYNIVHACDFDTAFPVYLANLISEKKMIFDVFDWMSDSSKKGIIYRIIGYYERKIFLKSNYSIICEEERKGQIPVQKNGLLVMPNIPENVYKKDSEIENIVKKQKKDFNIILSYVGVFDYDRGLEDLLQVVSQNPRIYLNIAGFGRLEDTVRLFAKKNKNIKYWGKVDYNKGLNIMKNSDIIVAMYYKTNPLHRYAAPNKYYEGLMLSVPIITTVGTLVGEKTENYNTGFAIKEGKCYLQELLLSPCVFKLIREKKNNADNLWNKKYKNFIQNFMENEYSKIIESNK